MVDKIIAIKESIRRESPLIHSITNPISINQCANAILSVGAKPIMAEHPEEVGEITCQADGLMLNLGNITDTRMESMMISLGVAKEKGIPVLLDVVGVACSTLRREFVRNLFCGNIPWVIKGNYSEILALFDTVYTSRGVDAEDSLGVSSVVNGARELAKKYQAVILATGETDIVTDGTRVVYIQNGTPELRLVTGTGCMLGSLVTTFLTGATPMDASVAACCYLGICGELAKTHKGYGSFMVNVMDGLSTIRRTQLEKHLRMEEP